MLAQKKCCLDFPRFFSGVLLQLRYATSDTTFNRYGHLFPEVNREAAKKLDMAIFGRAARRRRTPRK